MIENDNINATICLEAVREHDIIKIGLHEPGDTIRHYDEIKAPMETVEKGCYEIADILNKAGRRGDGEADVLGKLKSLGCMLCDELLTRDIKRELEQSDAKHLILNIDDHLVHIPWELVYIKEDFLCRRFNMGRMVKTRQKVTPGSRRGISPPFNMWILANPGGDLAGADSEGMSICGHMDGINSKGEIVNASFDSVISSGDIKSNIRNYDLIHFAGHADYYPKEPEKSGWKLSSGNLTAHDIFKMSGGAKMPSLVFSNACQSARTEEWEIKNDSGEDAFGLANAFIVAGVDNYVGTFWEIKDSPGSLFALSFYRELTSGKTIGESVKMARLKLVEEFGEDSCWASYLLYGDPRTVYFEHQVTAHEPPQSRPTSEPTPPFDSTRSPGSRTIGKNSTTKQKIKLGLTIILLLTLTSIGTLLLITSQMQNSKLSPDDLLALQKLASNKKKEINKSLGELEKLVGSMGSKSASKKKNKG